MSTSLRWEGKGVLRDELDQIWNFNPPGFSMIDKEGNFNWLEIQPDRIAIFYASSGYKDFGFAPQEIFDEYCDAILLDNVESERRNWL